MFTFSVSVAGGIMAGIVLVCVAVVCLYGLRPYMRLAREAADADIALRGDGEVKTSVVVYCQSGEDVLLRTLDSLATQDHPDYEVIVVCDAGVEYASSIRESVAKRYDKVYVTFVQPGSHNLSRRKLANLVGIKASKGDVVVTTVANIGIRSDRWLRLLTAPFVRPEVDYVLGATHIDSRELRGPWKWYREFDTLLTDALWAGYAMGGEPYRGDGLNMAFRRRAFFDNKGYAKTMFLQNGDDDVLLRDVADGTNTVAVVEPDAILTTEWGASANRVWTMRKDAYAFTSRWLRRGPSLRSGLTGAMQWVALLATAAAILTDFRGLVAPAVALVALLTMWVVEIRVCRKMAARMAMEKPLLGVVPFWLWRPIGDMLFNMMHAGSRKKNYTWQR